LTDVLQISSTVQQPAKTLFVVNSDKQRFLILMKSNLSIFSFLVNSLYALFKKTLYEIHEDITLYFIPEALLFYLSHLDLWPILN